MWFGEPAAILEAVEITGLEHLDRLLEEEQRILMLAPHFIALDAAGTRIAMHLKRVASFYTHQSDPDFDRIIYDGRSRFNEVHLISRNEGIRGLIRHLRSGMPIYYLPDMDFGREGAVFVPFFGVQAATLTATAQIAKTSKAAVVPVVSRLDAQTGRYYAEILPPLENFPGEMSVTEATAHLSHLIETWVRRDPPQYYWVHRRYKTRPPGEKKFY
jgi:KDO2-lipid IV(A) lauroyltransferase